MGSVGCRNTRCAAEVQRGSILPVPAQPRCSRCPGLQHLVPPLSPMVLCTISQWMLCLHPCSVPCHLCHCPHLSWFIPSPPRCQWLHHTSIPAGVLGSLGTADPVTSFTAPHLMSLCPTSVLPGSPGKSSCIKAPPAWASTSLEGRMARASSCPSSWPEARPTSVGSCGGETASSR